MTTDDYFKDVSLQLRDLPWKVRRELVSELLPTGTSFRQRLGG
jgi:hypothetical protein